MSLVFLGPKRVKRVKGGTYNCPFTLKQRGGNADGADTELTPLAVIPNIVREGATGLSALKAAKPASQGGDNSEPPNDAVFKVIIQDYHGTRTAENLTLLGDDGDNNSNPKYYRDRGWMADVKPAIPFRVVVRKYISGNLVDLDKDLKVVVEIKDPKEELTQNDGRRRTFISDFFGKYNRTDSKPTKGDDNASTTFKGLRAPSGSHPGAKATDVLKKVDYKSPPLVDTPDASNAANPLGNDTVDFASLAAATAEGAMAAKFDVTKKDLAGKKVGVADFTFVPAPVGGDNYRFLLQLVDGSDKDIRDTKENGRSVELRDHLDGRIAKPQCYVTGRFVIWREIKFTLCVLACGTTEADITWAFITSAYRKAFVEVVPPATGAVTAGGSFYTLTRAKWAQMVKSAFTGIGPSVTTNANFTDPIYQGNLFPPNVATEATTGMTNDDAQNFLIEKLEQFGRDAIAFACTQAPGAIPNPSAGDAQTKQDDGHGLFMFLCKAENIGGTLGAYIGDRIFWMRRPSGANGTAWATSTCAHEFGHVRSLRHSHTTSDAAKWQVPANTLFVVNTLSNDQPLDHDAKDAFACLMSYTRSLLAEPCGLCALGMRFFDRVEIQKEANYRKEIVTHNGPVVLASYAEAAGVVTLTPAGASIAMHVGDTVEILALGPETAYTVRQGANRRGRPNLSYFPKGENLIWRVSNSAVIALDWQGGGTSFVRKRITALAVGTSVVHYRQNRNPSASLTVNVT